jgi:hypothetical protein
MVMVAPKMMESERYQKAIDKCLKIAKERLEKGVPFEMAHNAFIADLINEGYREDDFDSFLYEFDPSYREDVRMAED